MQKYEQLIKVICQNVYNLCEYMNIISKSYKISVFDLLCGPVLPSLNLTAQERIAVGLKVPLKHHALVTVSVHLYQRETGWRVLNRLQFAREHSFLVWATQAQADA